MSDMMITHIAKGIASEMEAEFTTRVRTKWEDYSTPVKVSMVVRARGAVKAMRDIGSDRFFEIMSDSIGTTWGFGKADAEIAWKAAIDAILNEPQP
jgi:hypothetical protein